MDGSDSPYDSSLDRMLDLYAARIAKLEKDLSMARAEIAALREAVRAAYYIGQEWLSMRADGGYQVEYLSDEAEAAIRRALEEKP